MCLGPCLEQDRLWNYAMTCPSFPSLNCFREIELQDLGWRVWGRAAALFPPTGLTICSRKPHNPHGAFPHRFEYLFNFDNTFEIHDDIEVLKRMGMACGLESGNCSAEDLKVARSLVPKALEPYVTGQLCPVTGHAVVRYIPSAWVSAGVGLNMSGTCSFYDESVLEGGSVH